MEYAHLRSWYLARLRKNIVRKQQQATSLTPMAQIRADKLAVQELIAGSAPKVPKQELDLPRHPTLVQLICFTTLISTVVSAALIIFCIVPGNSAISLCAGIGIWILGLVPSTLVLRHTCVRLAQIGGILESIKSDADDSEPATEEPLLRLGSLTKRAVNAYYQSVEREHAIADYALDFFVALDDNGVVIAASPSAFEFCSFDQIELIGRNLIDLCADVDTTRMKSFLETTRQKSDQLLDCRWCRKDEKLMDVRLSAEYSPTERAFFCVASNITKERELDRIRNQMVAMIGHDLKTPLTSVSCSLDLLEMSNPGLPNKSVDTLRGMQTNLARLLEMLDELLDLSKLEAGKVPITKGATAIGEIFEAAAQSVSGAIIARNLKLVSPPAPHFVVADKRRILQVVINLLSNAIKFSPDGGTITITVLRRGDFVVTTVEDEGQGVPAKFKQLIFEQFRQVDEERDSALGGTGLGLAICKQIVELHGGRIGVESEGRGSSFWFSLLSAPGGAT